MLARIMHLRSLGSQYNPRGYGGMSNDELGRLPDWDAGSLPTGANHRSRIPMVQSIVTVSIPYYRVLVLYFYHSCGLV